jgi:GNAT superfamily N-acetyltransferase
VIRTADADDRGFLQAMLFEAVNWNPDRSQIPLHEVLARQDFARYVVDWPRSSDEGVLAVEAGDRLGAAWYRFFPSSQPGYGYVDEAVPEVSIALLPAHRGRGIGTRLMSALADLAAARHVGALSLSVESANPARRLYERLGYRTVSDNGEAVTMRLALSPPQDV